jgi:ubiquitin C-terminal hydrolase
MYIKPDVLEGENKYFCEKYGTHIDASRRNYIKEISDTFIINLKRFEFDFT